jgi:TatD DNase family protein
MHCFSGDADFLKECLDMGLFVSFTCNLTFKNAKRLREVAKGLPVERLLLETDAPFLAPENLRGSRNEPAYLTYLVDEWSRLLGLSREDITRITTHNANRLFGLGLEEPSRVAYPIRNSLYLNITNECTNTCDFCIRYQTPFVKGHNLKLEKEPTVDEILGSVGDPEDYKEVVFCGYGEPTARLDVVKAVAKELKRKGVRTRLVTNGHGDLINSRPIARELAGLIDNVSVSLNVDSKDRYNEICKPRFGAETYDRILDFIRSCAANGIATEVTCLDLAGVDLKRCEELSRNLGAAFRRRSAGVVG